MAIQKYETYAWGAIRRAPQEVKPGTVVDLGLGAEMRVQGQHAVVVLQSDTAGWEGLEMKKTLKNSEINETHLQADTGLVDFLTGHRVVYQWTPH